MEDLGLRAATARDAAEIVALNARAQALTSPMDAPRFRALLGMCSVAAVAERDGAFAGFLMGFDDGAAYDSPNYRWFAGRLKGFFYIDRVVVAEPFRGSGLGRAFYRHVEERAVHAGLRWLAAEMNVEPPNQGSLAFHAARGFVEVGRHVLDGGKVVSMQVRGVTGPAR